MGKNGGCWEDVSTGIHQDKQTKKQTGRYRETYKDKYITDGGNHT